MHIGRSPEGSNYLRGAIDDVRIYSSALSGTEISALVGGGGPTNQPPVISLSTPTNGANFPLAAIIPVSASATDPDGTVTRVDFYAGSTLIGFDTSSPYSVSWPNVSVGSYSLTAVARDNGGSTTVSSTRDITVSLPNLPSTAVFTPLSNHTTAVQHLTSSRCFRWAPTPRSRTPWRAETLASQQFPTVNASST